VVKFQHSLQTTLKSGIVSLLIFTGGCAGVSSYKIQKTIPKKDVPRTILFAGYVWRVKSGIEPIGPGPNYFSDSRDNVWVDKDGALHLKITQREGKWFCAEIATEKSFGYATYSFVLAKRDTHFDKNAVLGFFTWDDTSSVFDHREIDIEFSLWSGEADKNTVYSVRPGQKWDNQYEFDMDLTEGVSTHSFDWRTGKVEFISARGDSKFYPEKDKIINRWVYTGDVVEVPNQGSAKFRVNLWLFKGEPPSDGREVEVIIRDVSIKR